MGYEKALDVVRKKIKEDPELYFVYQANMAMSFHDEAVRQKSRDSREKLRLIGNEAAKNFLNLLVNY